MIFGRTNAERDAPKWWFAWHPVSLEDDGRHVWLEWVWRMPCPVPELKLWCYFLDNTPRDLRKKFFTD